MNFTQHKPQRGVKLQPLDVIDGFMARPGFYNRDGATASSNGVSFTIHSFGATECVLLLFHPHESEPYARLKFPESYHIGNTYSMLVFGLNIEEFEYAFQLDGPYDREKGLLFNKDNILLDPYARAVTGQRNWGERPEGGENFIYRARVVENNYDWGNMKQLEYPLEDLVIYEMHVRGFTKDDSSGVSAKGTYEGLREKIPYLKDLGVNAVELMPIFEFDEMESARIVDGEQLYNYWGYNTVCFFAPNTGYSSVVEHNHEGDELKQMIYELKLNGIEVILDVVFNHTAEGNENGPCFSFKGIDNNIYYNFMYKALQKNIHAPIIAGIMPVTKSSQIKQIISLSGNMVPPRFKAIVDRFADYPAAMRQAGIAYATEQIIDLVANGVNHIHIYTMNKPDVAGAILNNLSEIIN